MTMIIEANNLQKSYGDLPVLKGIDLTIEKGEIVVIVGASGAGKTTLLQLLGTLSSPDPSPATQLRIAQQDVIAFNDKELARFRNQSLGFVFQFHELLPEFTALENVMIPGRINGQSVEDLKERATQLLRRLGLSERTAHFPTQLSGGEQQRVAVARALMNRPAVIFADEPTGNLDSKNADEMHELFFELRKELNQTFVIVTHNKTLAAMADRTITLKDGKII